MQLCLVRLAGAEKGAGPGRALTVLDISLDASSHKTGDVWHVAVQGLKDLETLSWGWRADGQALSKGEQ
jgi:hypothetical protein